MRTFLVNEKQLYDLIAASTGVGYRAAGDGYSLRFSREYEQIPAADMSEVISATAETFSLEEVK